MPSEPRTTRASDTVAGAEDVRPHRPHARPPRQQQRQQQQKHQHTHAARSLRPKTVLPSYPSESDDEQPAAKKRKLSIRAARQTTLDHFTTIAQSASPHATTKPPNKVTLSQPGGLLEETINGVKHDLDVDASDLGLPTPRGTTPASNSNTKPTLAKKGEKRTLRSQDEGPRLKSELAVYFPNYEDIIFDAPKEEEFITVDTVFYVTDDPGKAKGESTSPAKSAKGGKTPKSNKRHGSANSITSPTTPQRSASNQFNGSPSLNFDSISKNLPERPEDPLTDEHFLKAHRRAERKEKQLRNIEKERAMHEKVQLDRLLDGLKGHDWLKVLGITGITDGEAKKYEPKRDHFIAEVQALVDKFRQWKEQEKKLKMQKEAALAAAEEDEEEDGSEDADEDESPEPPSSEMNDSAARQLQQETASALRQQSFKIQLASSKGKNSQYSTPKGTPSSSARFLLPPQPLVPEEPITSFYEKRHLRDAALGKARHGRSVTAFGQPVPELEEQEFELPEDYVSEDVLRANAREKRRRKRASVMDGAG